MRAIVAIALLAVLAAPATAAPGLITGRQIRPGTITGRQIKAHAIGSRELAAGIGQPGAQGPPGPSGPAGGQGPPGPAGAAGGGTTYTRIAEPSQTINGTSDSRSWDCPTGVAINGGAEGTGIAVVSAPTNASDPAGPDQTPGSWYIAASHANGFWQYHPWIVCAS